MAEQSVLSSNESISTEQVNVLSAHENDLTAQQSLFSSNESVSKWQVNVLSSNESCLKSQQTVLSSNVSDRSSNQKNYR